MESVQNVLQSSDVEPSLKELVESKLAFNSNLLSEEVNFADGKFDVVGVVRKYVAKGKCLIKECCQNAVKMIMSKHAKCLKSDSILDLHYLFVLEAIVQMDDFLDHIRQSRLKVDKAPKFFLQIITGPG